MSGQRKKKNYPLVEVEWVDSSSDTGWRREVGTELLVCWSAGYLVHRDERSTVVALNCSSQGSVNSCGDTIIIPSVCVQKVRRLK